MSHWSESCTLELWEPYDVDDPEVFGQLLSQGKIIKDNSVRTVRRMSHGILKEYKKSRSLIKAQREFRHLEETHRLGLPVPQVYWEFVHFGQPYLLMEDLGDAPTLYDQVNKNFVSQDELIKLGKLIHDMIQLGCAHRDFHSGNLLVKDKNIFLVDLDAASLKPGPLTWSEMYYLLSSLISSLEPLEREQHHLWLSEALPQMSQRQRDQLIDQLYQERLKIWKKHFASRVRKALKESGSWIKDSSQPLVIRARHWDCDVRSKVDYKNEVEYLKQDVKTKVWTVFACDRNIVVKEFTMKQPIRKLLGLNRARVSWKNTIHLHTRKLPIAQPLAFYEYGDGTGYIVLEKIENAIGFDQWLWERWDSLDSQQRKSLISDFAYFIKQFKEKLVWPGDFKACNVLHDGENFYLVDYDNMLYDQEINQEKIYRSLMQLHLSIPKKINELYRWYFILKVFDSPELARKMFVKVMHESKGKTIIYQSKDGDREENW